ncbi:hypothetical protein KRR26_28560 [Corallococcus sp. M34]|uniref:hypothetical protein n=1 Tax=Citreicoccus inhibens TaxID=2849499 RepID=UPI001C24295D|nr:hypothetical protein [Citreicoccus inhibens]MBU8899568.1 hypothetical protein [Citreicoccus inhibens]
MIYTSTGTQGANCAVRVKAEPAGGVVIIKGKGPNAAAMTNDAFVDVGSIPTTVDASILFFERPWSITIQGSVNNAAGQEFSTTSDRQGLPTTVLVTPDAVPVSFVFKE